MSPAQRRTIVILVIAIGLLGAFWLGRAHAANPTAVRNKQFANRFYPHNPYQDACRSFIVMHESGWQIHAENPSSHAYGLIQRMPPYNAWYMNHLRAQVVFGENYVRQRFGTWCQAKAFWTSHGWF